MDSLSVTDLPSTLWVVVAFTSIMLLLHLWWSKPQNLPPGPFSLPLVGTVPFLGMDPREPLRRLGKKYGDVFTIYLGSRRVIILNSFDAIKEAFVKKSYAMSGRPQDLFWIESITKGKGLVSRQGPALREQRHFAHSVLREMGVGTTKMEDKIMEEISHLFDALEKLSSAPCDVTNTIQRAVANIIYSTIFGHRCKYDDPAFIQCLRILKNNFEVMGNASALAVFPYLKYLPGDFFKFHRLVESSAWVEQGFGKEIELHKHRIKESSHSNDSADFIDAYLKTIQEHDDKGAESSFNEEELVRVIGDLFAAGTDTTTSTITWGLTYMLHNPDVLPHVRAEIDKVIGSQRRPKMADRSQMPYTNAFICEVQRIADIVPLGVPHCTTEEVLLYGYTVPEGTMVMSNLYAVNRDSKLWPDPERFDPTRFLNPEGKFHRPETLIPFSMGKRVCLGEAMARMELFLIFTSLLQNFEFSVPPGHDLPTLNGTLCFTYKPKPFEIMLSRR